ncbi:Unknown protein, partial [Striga hermonthica]
MAPPKAILRQVEKLCSNLLWARDDSNLKRVFRAWDRLTFPVAENGLALRSLEDVLRAFSCKIWWKWCTGKGLWARYLQQVSWENSVARRRLIDVDSLMRSNTLVQDVYINGRWDVSALEELLPQDALQYVLTFHFEFLPRSDVIIWRPSLRGISLLSLFTS